MNGKLLFEYEISDECGWRNVEIYWDSYREDFYSIAFDQDGGEVPVNDNWGDKLKDWDEQQDEPEFFIHDLK